MWETLLPSVAKIYVFRVYIIPYYIFLDNRLSKGGLTAFDVFVIVTCLSSLVLALRTILKRDSQMKVCLALYVLLGFFLLLYCQIYFIKDIFWVHWIGLLIFSICLSTEIQTETNIIKWSQHLVRYSYDSGLIEFSVQMVFHSLGQIYQIDFLLALVLYSKAQAISVALPIICPHIQNNCAVLS